MGLTDETRVEGLELTGKVCGELHVKERGESRTDHAGTGALVLTPVHDFQNTYRTKP